MYLDWTGGTDICLDSEPTLAADDSGTNCRLVIIAGVTEVWQLVSSNHVDDPPNGWIRPLDYSDGTNQKVWMRTACFGTGSGGGQRFIQVVVQQDTPAYSIVTSTGLIANSGNLAHYGRVVGMTEIGVLNGTVVNVIDDLDVTNNAWAWSPGTYLYLNGSTISATPPSSGFSQRVATASNANIIIMGPTNANASRIGSRNSSIVSRRA